MIGPHDRSRPERRHKIIVGILMLVLVGQCLTSMRLKSPTFDEVGHLPAGYSYLKKNDYRLYPANPPLVKQIAALPLLFLHVKAPFSSNSWQEAHALLFGKALLFQSGNNPDELIFAARFMMVLLSSMLGLYVFRWAAGWFGPKAGLFALFLYVLHPNILAYSQLATTDLGFTAFAFIATYYFVAYLEHHRRKDFWMAVAGAGAAFAAKYTAVLLLPAFFLIGVVYIIWRGQSLFASRLVGRLIRRPVLLKRLAELGCLVVVLALLAHIVVVADYGFKSTPLVHTENGAARLSIFLQKVPGMRSHAITGAITSVARKVPIPARDYFANLTMMLGLQPKLAGEDGGAPYARYLMGRSNPDGFWYFPIIALCIKEPLPLLFLLLVAVLLIRKNGFWPKAVLLMPVGVLLIAGMKSHAFAYRYVNLPVLPFLLVFCASLVRDLPRRWPAVTALAFAAGWLLLDTLRIYPHYLAYFNESVGGPENGYKYMVNSNLDWGQDLKLLASYLRRADRGDSKLAYFGTADPAAYGIHARRLQGVSEATFEPAGKENPIADSRPTAGLIAISATCLQNIGGFYPGATYDWLKRFEPIDKIGYTIFIYDVPAAAFPASELNN